MHSSGDSRRENAAVRPHRCLTIESELARRGCGSYARGRRHAGSLATRTAVDAARCTRVQVVQTKAIRLHSQSGPSAALETGSGEARPIARTAATQPSETMAATKAISLRVHICWNMAAVLFTGGE